MDVISQIPLIPLFQRGKPTTEAGSMYRRSTALSKMPPRRSPMRQPTIATAGDPSGWPLRGSMM